MIFYSDDNYAFSLNKVQCIHKSKDSCKIFFDSSKESTVTLIGEEMVNFLALWESYVAIQKNMFNLEKRSLERGK